MQILKTVLTWLFIIAAPLSVIFFAMFIYFKLKKDEIKRTIWKKRVKIIGYAAIALFLLLSSVNTVITKAENKVKAQTEEIKYLTISNDRVGLPFSKIIDKLPTNATVDRKVIEEEAYYSIRFDQKLMSFNSDGLLMYISVDMLGTGVDNAVKVGDQENSIKGKMGSATKKTKDSEGYLYVYDYSTYEVQVHTKNDIVNNIQMLDKPNQEPVTNNLTGEGRKLLDYYDSKTKSPQS